ncbi:MAG: leucine-rich repeat protein [Lachnospiraceae bacterium]|nr:leucine-rich repeat protein [Lachnospiraceae bacterium]
MKKRISLLMAAVLFASTMTVPVSASEELLVEQIVSEDVSVENEEAADETEISLSEINDLAEATEESTKSAEENEKLTEKSAEATEEGTKSAEEGAEATEESTEKTVTEEAASQGEATDLESSEGASVSTEAIDYNSDSAMNSESTEIAEIETEAISEETAKKKFTDFSDSTESEEPEETETTEQTTESGETEATSLLTNEIAATSVEESEAEDNFTLAAEDSSDILYSGTCGENLTWQLDSNGTLTISGSGAMSDYNYNKSAERAPWYSYRYQILSIVVESGVTSIGTDTFIMCEKVTSVSLPTTLKSIGEGAFTGCYALAEIAIPEGVTEIQDGVFSHCTALVSVSLPSTLTSIGSMAFDSCIQLSGITIPAGVTSIGDDVFTVCYNLAEIQVASSNSSYCSVDGVLFTKDKKALVRYPSAKADTSYTIPSGVTTVESGAFNYCKNLASITLSNTVETVEENVFYYCTGLTQITFSENLKTLGGCTFSGCSKLTSITIPESMTTIDYGTFTGCTSLTCVTIPESITSIYTGAFGDCTSITDVYYAGSSDSWSKITIGSENDTLTGAAIHYGKEMLSSCTATLSATSYTYDGTAKKPTVEVKNGSETLAAGTDYTVSYSNNTNAGTATVTVKGKGNYEGSITKTFTIKKASQTLTAKAAASTVKAGKTTQITASGKGNITYSSGSTSIATVSSSGVVTAKKPGTVKITVKAAGNSNYNAASKTVTIKVTLAAGKISSLKNTSSGITIKWSKVTGASGYYIYRKTASGTYQRIKTIKSGSTLSYTDKTVKSKNGTTYLYAVKPYSGSTKGSYVSSTVVRLTGTSLSSVKNASSKKMTVKWTKKTKVTGYQIQYSTSSTFASGNTAVKVSGSTKVSKTISSLKKGTTYYVRIRTYKTVSGKNYYSAWSSVEKVKIAK